jgi:hypothetical protein
MTINASPGFPELRSSFFRLPLSMLLAATLSACSVQAEKTPLAGPEKGEKRDRGVALPLRANPLLISAAKQQPAALRLRLQQQRIDPARANGYSVEPVLASYHRDGVDHLVIGWHHYGPGPTRDSLRLGTAVSHDSAQSWNVRIIDRVSNLGSIQYDPFAAADGVSQTLFLGALAVRAFNDEPPSVQEIGMYLASATGPAALGAPSVLGTDPEDKPAAIFVQNSQSSNGTLFIAAAARHRRSNNLGQSFQSLANGEPGFVSVGHQPIIFPTGEVINLTIGFTADNSPTITTISSADLGTTLAPRRTARVLNYASLMTLDSAVPGRFRMAPFGQAALAPNGRLYYAFPEITSELSGERNVDVLLIHSDDRGMSWSHPIRVNAEGVTPRDQFMPAMAISPDGIIHLVYADTRRSTQADASINAEIDFVYARSGDGGLSFSELFLTESPIDVSEVAWRPYENDFPEYYIGDYIAITSPSPNAVYIAHPDREASDPAQLAMKLSKVSIDDTLFGDGFESRFDAEAR